MRVRLLALVALLVLASACNRIGVAEARGPNVLLVTIDTLRADRVGVYGAGEGRTPEIDRLARDGRVYETVLSVAPLTLPAHASVLTGLEPPRHGVRHNGMYRLAERHPTLAERFAGAGYATAAFVSSAVLDRRYGLDRGFDHYDDALSASASRAGYRERRAAETTDAARAWLVGQRRPFFLWVHYFDPHTAYRPPSPHRERFPGDPYAGEIAYVDAELGRLIGDLRRSGELDRTLVSITADHGESLGEHGEATHAYTLYDAALRVPWVLRGPGVAPGRVLEVASLADVTPTLLSLAGFAPIPALDGRAWSKADAGRSRMVYAETLATQLDHGWAPLHALRTPTHLYVRAPRKELYELRSDAGQLRNLIQGPELWQEADRYDQVLVDRLAATEESERIVMDSDTRRELHALGYLVEEDGIPATDLDPKDGLPLLERFGRAEAHYFADRLDAAVREAESLLVDWPGSPRLHNLLVRVHLDRRDFPRALHHAEVAARLVPRSARHRATLGEAQLAAGDRRAALDTFAAALERDPQLDKAHLGRMWALAEGGSLEDAVAHAEAAVAGDPRDPLAHVRVAERWDRLGHYDRALASYERAVELDPTLAVAHLGLALQHARLGSLERSRHHRDRAGPIGAAPGNRVRLAVAYAVRGERDEALALLRGTLEQHPDFEPARRALRGVLSGEAKARREPTS